MTAFLVALLLALGARTTVQTGGTLYSFESATAYVTLWVDEKDGQGGRDDLMVSIWLTPEEET